MAAAEYDAIVVGAGPAGSATAALLAAANHRVLLVDRARFPRSKPCAEYVSPGGAALLERLGVFGDHLDLSRTGRWLRGMQISAPNGSTHLLDYHDPSGAPRYGLSVARSELDMALLGVARARGAEVREACRIVAFQGPRSRPPTVVADDGSALAGHLVIGADGLHSVIARAAGPPPRLVWPRRLGLTSHLVGVAWPEDYGQMRVGPRGYVGVAPLDDHGWLTLGLVRRLPRPDQRLGSAAGALRQALADYPQLAQRLASGSACGPVQGMGPLARRVRTCAGPGYLLVGDAAGFFDPFTGEGIFRALRGAELAAACASRALRTGNLGGLPLAYSRARSRAFAAKERLTALIQLFVQVPALMNHAVDRLQQRPLLARRLGNVLGDLEPAGLDLVWGLLKPAS